MLTNLGKKVASKVQAGASKVLNIPQKVVDLLEMQDDVDDIKYHFGQVAEDLHLPVEVFRDNMSRNNWATRAGIIADEKRQKKLEAFLGPNAGVAFKENGPFDYDAHPVRGSMQTRILRLQAGKDMEIVECEMETVDLDDPDLEYEALSYHWGAEKPLTPINCNGRRLDVTQNLKMALNNLRPSQGSRTLWVDAICINQKDKQECARQVLLMREIYGRAAQVVVWVGETSVDARASFAVLRHLADLVEDAEGKALDYEEIKTRASRIELEGWPSSLYFKRTFHMVQCFEEAHYFTRMWVLQEVALARNVLLLSGQNELPWETFEKGMLVRALVATRDRRSRPALRRSLDLPVLKIIELRMAIVSGEQDRSLLYLLNQFRGQGAKIPADKVYAILGLTDTNILDINLRVDYSIPTAQFYTDLAAGILMSPSAGGLDLLSVPRAESDLSREMPSWSPDWSHGAASAQPLLASVSRYSSSERFCASGELPEGSSCPCTIDGSKLYLSGHIVDRIERLTTEAFTDIEPSLAAPSVVNLRDGLMGEYDEKRKKQIDAHYKPLKKSWTDFLEHPPLLPPAPPPRNPSTLSTTTESTASETSCHQKSPNEKSPEPPLAKQENESLLDFMKRFPYPPALAPGPPSPSPSQSLGTAYIRTLFADSFPRFLTNPNPNSPTTTTIPTTATEKLLISALSYWLALEEVNPHGMWSVLERLSDLLPSGIWRFPDAVPTGRFVDVGGMMGMMLGRKLMWTRDGYFGAAPAGAREGDVVVLVRGCGVPLVLRARGGVVEVGLESGKTTEWELVGDCFMHGAMYGERWGEEECGEVVVI